MRTARVDVDVGVAVVVTAEAAPPNGGIRWRLAGADAAPPPPLRGSRSTSSKKWAWHSRDAKSTCSFLPARARPRSSCTAACAQLTYT